MQPLRKVLPSSDEVLYVVYDFETTQNTRYSDRAEVHVPNLYVYSRSVRNVRARRISSRNACSAAGSNGRYFSVSLQTSTLGQKDYCISIQRQVIGSACNFEQSYILKMAPRIDNERTKDHVHDGRTHEVY